MNQPRLEVVPVTFRQASAYVAQLHRHHKPPRGTKFCIGVIDQAGELHGVAMVGRPVARHYDDGRTAEVNRTCTDGTPNANSALYGAAWRVAREMGYKRIITYTQDGESGASLRGAGWVPLARRPARGNWWDHTGAEARETTGRDPDLATGGVDRTLWVVERAA